MSVATFRKNSLLYIDLSFLRMTKSSYFLQKWQSARNKTIWHAV